MNHKQHIGLFLLRTSIALTMLIYGITKVIFGNGFINSILLDKGLPQFLGYGVYVGEIIAPLLIILGVRTKLVGLVFSFNCIVALILAQLPNVFSLNPYGGWAIGLLFIYIVFGIALFFSGAGKYAISTKSKWD